MTPFDRPPTSSAAPTTLPVRPPQLRPGGTPPMAPGLGSVRPDGDAAPTLAFPGAPIGFHASPAPATETALRALSADVETRVRRLSEMEERLADAVESARRALSDQAEDLRRRAARIQEIEERVRALSTWAEAQVREREAGLSDREQAVAEREARLQARRWPFRRR
ncbi:MAG TPA: hypothetical protein VMW47_07515 [Verrucomicrobiae bacterium]|nr:hypothetical protein [Verrucomicrobiae bacterium]